MLGSTPDYQEREAQRQFAKQQTTAGHYRKKPAARRVAPAPRGHEAFLKALESSGAEVSFEKISNGEIVIGTIKCSDAFTISVDVGGKTRVLYKHDISEFSPLASRAQE